MPLRGTGPPQAGPTPAISGFETARRLQWEKAGTEEELLARNDDEVTTPDVEDVPFDPWENDEDESDRRRDPLRQPGARREAVEGEEEPAI